MNQTLQVIVGVLRTPDVDFTARVVRCLRAVSKGSSIRILLLESVLTSLEGSEGASKSERERRSRSQHHGTTNTYY